MKIYRAYITYNNGDYNEWEEVYRAESPWYTSREEAEKHFFELARLRDWLRYKHRENGDFHASDPEIEVQDLVANDVYSPMEIIHTKYGTEAFELSKFHYIEEIPSLEITNMVMMAELGYPGVDVRFMVTMGGEEFYIAFTRYNDDGYYIDSTDNKENKFCMYSEKVRQILVDAVKEKLVDAVLPITQNTKEYWEEFHKTKDKEREDSDKKWHTARLTELKNVQKICTLFNIIPDEGSVNTLARRFRDIKELLEYCPEESDLYAEELAYIKELLKEFKWKE